MLKAVLKYLLHTLIMFCMLMVMAIMYVTVGCVMLGLAFLSPFFSWGYDLKYNGLSFKFEKKK